MPKHTGGANGAKEVGAAVDHVRIRKAADGTGVRSVWPEEEDRLANIVYNRSERSGSPAVSLRLRCKDKRALDNTHRRRLKRPSRLSGPEINPAHHHDRVLESVSI